MVFLRYYISGFQNLLKEGEESFYLLFEEKIKKADSFVYREENQAQIKTSAALGQKF